MSSFYHLRSMTIYCYAPQSQLKPSHVPNPEPGMFAMPRTADLLVYLEQFCIYLNVVF